MYQTWTFVAILKFVSSVGLCFKTYLCTLGASLLLRFQTRLYSGMLRVLVGVCPSVLHVLLPHWCTYVLTLLKYVRLHLEKGDFVVVFQLL